MNAIEKRVIDLQERWETFVQSDAKLLRWLADQREIRVIDGFIKLQAEEHDYHAGDLFFSFDTPFVDENQYATALVTAFKADYDNADKEAKQAGQALPEWRPDEQKDRDPVTWLATTWCSFAELFGDNFRFLVAYLRPQQIDVADTSAYIAFVAALIAQLPDNTRVLFPDTAERPFADALEQNELVQSDKLELDMDRAYTELAQTSGGEGPGYEFRNLMVAAMQAGNAGYTAAFVTNLDNLLDLTTTQDWLQQAIVVHMLAGGVAMNSKEFTQVIAHYTSAIELAKKLRERSDPVGPVCLYQANMAVGTAYLVQEKADYPNAAEHFIAATKAAAECGDTQKGLYLIEAWRMAAHAHSGEKKIAAAWEALWQSHAAAALLPEEIAPTDTTLAEVGKALLQLTQKQHRWIGGSTPYAGKANMVRDAFTSVLGESWDTA